jgi:hypothetical protein
MELKYLVARFHQKRVLFVILNSEEESVKSRLAEASCDLFFSGDWQEGALSQKKFERWFARVDRWVVTSALVESDVLSSMVCDAHVSGKRVEDLEAFFLEVEPAVPANPQQLIHFLTTKGVPKNQWVKLYSCVRYSIEPVIALAIILLLSPIMLLVALAVKFTSTGPIL